MLKKKLSKRSLLEAQRAQFAVNRDSYVSVKEAGAIGVATVKSSFLLPIRNIKMSLRKDFIFAILSIAFLIYLKESRLGFTQISAFFAK